MTCTFPAGAGRVTDAARAGRYPSAAVKSPGSACTRLRIDVPYSRTGDREVDVPAGGGERISQQTAAGAGLGLGEDQDVLGTPGEPLQLALCSLLRGVADVEGQERQTANRHERSAQRAKLGHGR